MPKAIMRSLAASLLMSHGMLGNVNEPERMGQTSASRSRRENLYFFAETILFLSFQVCLSAITRRIVEPDAK